LAVDPDIGPQYISAAMWAVDPDTSPQYMSIFLSSTRLRDEEYLRLKILTCILPAL
jgi:hypothetical protein